MIILSRVPLNSYCRAYIGGCSIGALPIRVGVWISSQGNPYGIVLLIKASRLWAFGFRVYRLMVSGGCGLRAYLWPQKNWLLS